MSSQVLIDGRCVFSRLVDEGFIPYLVHSVSDLVSSLTIFGSVINRHCNSFSFVANFMIVCYIRISLGIF